MSKKDLGIKIVGIDFFFEMKNDPKYPIKETREELLNSFTCEECGGDYSTDNLEPGTDCLCVDCAYEKYMEF